MALFIIQLLTNS